MNRNLVDASLLQFQKGGRKFEAASMVQKKLGEIFFGMY